MNDSTIPGSAIVIGSDAYYLNDTSITWYQQDRDGIWQIVKATVSMCWGCFGDHSFISGKCWGVLCQCCGGTGWENGDMDFRSGVPLSNKSAICMDTQSLQDVLLHYLRTGLAEVHPLRSDKIDVITPALVRGSTAKIEIIAQNHRHMALLNRKAEDVWCLEAFIPLCRTCGGKGRKQYGTRFCPACGGLKWGELGALRYCFHTDLNWWTLVGEPIEDFSF
jgi:hypothetical protein